MRDWKARLGDWVGKSVVVDFKSSFVAIGVLADVGDDFLEMTAVDLHDLRDTETSREIYTVKAARLGVQANRTRLAIRSDDVLAVARLEDVIC